MLLWRTRYFNIPADICLSFWHILIWWKANLSLFFIRVLTHKLFVCRYKYPLLNDMIHCVLYVCIGTKIILLQTMSDNERALPRRSQRLVERAAREAERVIREQINVSEHYSTFIFLLHLSSPLWMLAIMMAVFTSETTAANSWSELQPNLDSTAKIRVVYPCSFCLQCFLEL